MCLTLKKRFAAIMLPLGVGLLAKFPSLDTALYSERSRAILCGRKTFCDVLTEGRDFEQYGEKFTPLVGHRGGAVVGV